MQKCTLFIREVLQQRPQLPIRQEQLHLFVANLHSQNKKHSTILTHMSAISHYHKMANLPDPTSSYATAKLLTGVRNSQSNQPDHHWPITKHSASHTGIRLSMYQHKIPTTDVFIHVHAHVSCLPKGQRSNTYREPTAYSPNITTNTSPS